jgi:hypothetical protein
MKDTKPLIVSSANGYFCEAVTYSSDGAPSAFRIFDQIFTMNFPALLRFSMMIIVNRNEAVQITENMSDFACEIVLEAVGPTTTFEVVRLPLLLPTLQNQWLTQRLIIDQPVAGFAGEGKYEFVISCIKDGQKTQIGKIPILVKPLANIPQGMPWPMTQSIIASPAAAAPTPLMVSEPINNLVAKAKAKTKKPPHARA